jgi:hypothetical protein
MKCVLIFRIVVSVFLSILWKKWKILYSFFGSLENYSYICSELSILVKESCPSAGKHESSLFWK